MNSQQTTMLLAVTILYKLSLNILLLISREVMYQLPKGILWAQ